MILYGNGFAYVKRDEKNKPKDLVYLPATSVQIVGTLQQNNVYYMCTGYKGVPDKLSEDDVLHLFKNTKDGLNGISVLKH